MSENKTITEQQLLALMRVSLRCAEPEDPSVFHDADWKAILSLAGRHRVLALAYNGVRFLPDPVSLPAPLREQLEKAFMVEVAKNESQLYAAQTLLDRFEAEEIRVMPVKGICTKARYPDSILRSMGDIDIICCPSQQRRIRAVMKQLGYTGFTEGQKHDHYSLKPFVTVEIHRSLFAADSPYAAYGDPPWSTFSRRHGSSCRYEMTAEQEFLYAFLHLVEHFRAGGVGLRFVLDVYIYNHLEGIHRDEVLRSLREWGLGDFFHNIDMLSERWFGCSTDENPLVDQLSDYILHGSVFGNHENASALAVGGKSRFTFLRETCFPSLPRMVSMFPWLAHVPFLLPFSWLLRGMRALLFRNRTVRSQWEIFSRGDRKRGGDLRKFYEECGLHL